MKHLISYLILILVISFSLPDKTIVLKGETNCALGKFIVKEATNPEILDGIKLDTYTITYENSAKAVTVAVCKEKDCCRYLVSTDDLSVQYICYEEYFGVSAHDNKFKKQGFETNFDSMDKSSYFHQKVITRSYDEKTLEGCLGLIAAFYPRLFADMEKVFSCEST